MIVITSLDTHSRFVNEGDTFNLTITDNMECQVILREEITVNKVINFIASYRFALEDGTCPGFHLCGIFGNKDELPEEMEKAVMLEELNEEQYEKFAKTVGTKTRR